MPSGCVHRWKAPGLAYIMSSTSGPPRLEEKGTLKERLTLLPGVEPGEAAAELDGCLMGGVAGGMWWLCGLEPKPIEGDTFSHPCLAEPVKFEILCMAEERRERLVLQASEVALKKRGREGDRARPDVKKR